MYYPNFNPVALKIGIFEIHWYGIMYLLSFVSIWLLARYRILRQRHCQHWKLAQFDDLLVYAAFGVIIGGRVGYMLFYALPEFVRQPAMLLRIWEGGMSFHGGFLGVLCASFLFSRKQQRSFFSITDFIAPLVPVGLALGRIANFINGELWGRITDVSWAMIFPLAGNVPRHPWPLYAVMLEGVLLFTMVWSYARKPRPEMAVSGVFAISYGLIRFVEEFWRQPDLRYGFIAFNWLTMGQILSLPLIVFGIWLLCRSRHR